MKNRGGIDSQFDLIVWDWDGTLADSTGMIATALVKAAAEVGLPALSLKSARGVIGLGLQQSIYTLFGEITAQKAQTLVERYHVNYSLREQTIPLFHGAEALVVELSRLGHKQAVATGKSRRELNLALERSKITKCFQATRTVDECFSKPHPQMLDELMDDCVVTPERTLMIGDTTYDLQMAQNAGVQSLAVTFGAHDSKKLLKYHPKGIFNQFSDLSEWLINNG